MSSSRSGTNKGGILIKRGILNFNTPDGKNINFAPRAESLPRAPWKVSPVPGWGIRDDRERPEPLGREGGIQGGQGRPRYGERWPVYLGNPLSNDHYPEGTEGT